MGTIAVAGGTGGLGRMMVEACTAAGKDVVILSRKAGTSNDGVPTLSVNYSDPSSVARMLEEHNITTIISTLSLMPSNEHELNLVRGAHISKSTKRFIPSSWGVPLGEKEAASFPPAKLKLEILTQLQKTSLEYTCIHCGYFLDYWGLPEVESYLQPSSVVFDIENNFAAVPGSGKTPIVFTHTRDIANFTVKALDLPKWQNESYIVGERITWADFIYLAQEAKGSKVEVVYDPIESLQRGQVTEIPAHKSFYTFIPKEQLQPILAVFGLWFDSGLFNIVPTENSMDLNKIFPEIKPLKIQSMLRQKFQTTV